MKRFSVLLVLLLAVIGSVASQNRVTEEDIIGTWRDNFGVRYVFDLERNNHETGTVTITGNVKGQYFLQGDEVVIVINNMLMTGTRPLSEDRRTMTFRDNQGLRITLTKLE